MSDYEKWRQFYADRIIGWMSADELRECCVSLGTADAPSPELLLIHAMREIELLELEIDGLKTCLLFKETP